MAAIIETIQQAEDFVKNLKRSDNWVSNDELIAKLKASYDLIQTNEREDLIPITSVHIALYYIDLGEYGEAWHYTETAKLKAEEQKNYDCLLNAISLQYRIQKNLGNLDTAQLLANEQIKIAYNINDILQIASGYYNQGLLYHRQKLKTNTIEAFIKSIEYIQKTNQTYYISNFNIGYAGILLDFKEYDLALKSLNIGFGIAIKNQYSTPLAMAYSNFGLLYSYQKKERKSYNCFKKSITIFEKLNYTNDMVSVKIMLSDSYMSFNKLDIAEKLLKETLEFSKKNKLRYNLIGIYESLSSLYEKKQEYYKALQYNKNLIKIKEEFLNNETDKKLKNLEITQKIDVLKIEKDNAVKMSSIKHEFLANMSHEIRTPINSILGICYLLEQQSLNKLQKDYIRRLHQSGINLLGIINDVLDISKIESGKMELDFQAFLINKLIDDIYSTLEIKANEKKIKFIIIKKYDSNLSIYSDYIRLYQVLLNVLSNAIKFTNQGNVTLEISSVPKSDNELYLNFSIKDTGIGIEKENINKIFSKYEQATNNINKEFGGTGLGLSISKKIIELLNGKIDVKSKINKGTSFYICIPFVISEIDLNHAKSDTISIDLLDNKIILIADDNEENRMVANEIIKSQNSKITLHEVCDGLETLNFIKKKKPDIILLDLDMPKFNGIEVVSYIRKNKKYNSIKIIGNTASLVTFSKEEFLELGFNDFIQKPYKVNDLLTKLVSVL
jgi:signal transduction histidine kinase/CheY-like chemotaxis protein